jgi:hypothetical protein
VVTLAAFLAFQGVVLLIIKGGTIVSIQDKVVLTIGNKFLSPAGRLGRLRGRRRRLRGGAAAAHAKPAAGAA